MLFGDQPLSKTNSNPSPRLRSCPVGVLHLLLITGPHPGSEHPLDKPQGWQEADTGHKGEPSCNAMLVPELAPPQAAGIYFSH